ncbi:hypothetical protein D3C84_799990 [compost metagenome]
MLNGNTFTLGATLGLGKQVLADRTYPNFLLPGSVPGPCKRNLSRGGVEDLNAPFELIQGKIFTQGAAHDVRSPTYRDILGDSLGFDGSLEGCFAAVDCPALFKDRTAKDEVSRQPHDRSWCLANITLELTERCPTGIHCRKASQVFDRNKRWSFLGIQKWKLPNMSGANQGWPRSVKDGERTQ